MDGISGLKGSFFMQTFKMLDSLLAVRFAAPAHAQRACWRRKKGTTGRCCPATYTGHTRTSTASARYLAASHPSACCARAVCSD